MRDVTIPLAALLDMIVAASDYGYDSSDALMSWFASSIHPLTDEEIESFAASYLTAERRAQGYAEEDADNVREELRAFRTKWAAYCNRVCAAD